MPTQPDPWNFKICGALSLTSEHVCKKRSIFATMQSGLPSKSLPRKVYVNDLLD